MLVTFQNLTTPADPVVVDDTNVLALEPVGGAGTRISISRGASDLTGPSFVEVVGTVLTVAAALPGARLALFTMLGTASSCAVSATWVSALEPIGSVGVRISIPRGASELTSPAPFVEVNGTIAAVIALFAAVPSTPASFAAMFLLQVAAGAITTNSAAFVFVTGAQIQIPPGGDGTWLIFVSAGVGTSALVNGVQISLSQNNGPPIAAIGVWGPGDLSTTESVTWATHLSFAAIAGDTFEIIARADPGGAGNDAVITEARIIAWRT